MKAVLQRVTSASVTVEKSVIGAIDAGLLILLGVQQGDEDSDFEYILNKTLGLRIFADEAGKMNRSVVDIGGSVLVVSQFTLLADVRKGKRPGFSQSAPPEIAHDFYERFVAAIADQNVTVASGQFAADMSVALVNDGPVTILLDSRSS